MTEELKQIITESIHNKSAMIKLSLNKDLKKIIEDKTSWMNRWFSKLPLKIRCLTLYHNYDEDTFPKCPICNHPVSYQKNYHDSFNEFCSEKCHHLSLKNNKLINTIPELMDKNWLYTRRIVERKSIEEMANEIKCSITPINEALKIYEIPKIKLNESDLKVLHFLNDKTWLVENHIHLKKTLDELADHIGTSKSTVSRWMAIHDIETNKPNSYDRSFNKNSKGCDEVLNFIREQGREAFLNNRSILNGKEIDIWIPSLNLAIEYNGIYWHSFNPNSDKESIKKDINYHYEKSESCRLQGIQLIHLWEDDWLLKKEIWKSRLRELCQNTKRKIPARKCVIGKIDSFEKSNFLKTNHLQGNDKSTIRLGLFYEKELVSVMTFCKARYSKKHDYELSRFCNLINTHVQGGFSKLLKFFRNEYNSSCVSYADKSYSVGNVYEKNGFKKINETKFNYWYVDPLTYTRLHRASFMKKRIAPNDKRTEKEIMELNGFKIIYGPGNLTYELK